MRLERPLVGLLLALSLGAPAWAALRVQVDDGMVAVLDAQGLRLEAEPLRGEGRLAFSRRLCGDESGSERILGLSDGRLRAGVRYGMPYDCLLPEYRSAALLALFPDDRATREGWRHRVGGSGGEQDLWLIAEWFTGKGENYRVLRQRNGLSDESAPVGSLLVIPTALLRAPFRQLAQLETLEDAPGADELRYGRDAQGDYAAYRLKRGEALYSSVVVRYTGRLEAEDVNQLAVDIARRNGIPDVTDIPSGFEVKIPLELLTPEYLPRGDLRRLEYEQNLAESSRYTNEVTASGLDGVVVLLDAGHGGSDPGATIGGTSESPYVYDIMLRVRRILISTTRATVLTTTRAGKQFEVREKDVLPASRDHEVLVTPPYPIREAVVGTNLRWYLSNSLYRKNRKQGVESKKQVFLSIHADSLHPSVRGTMIYVPGLLHVGEHWGRSEPVYASRKEVKEKQYGSFSRQQRVESEGLSRDLARHLLSGLSAEKVTIHPNRPVRDRIVRGRGQRPWIPAVLRYNMVPAKVLIEVCNLANRQDRELIRTAEFRERVARGVVDGLLDYYGYEPAGGEQFASTGAR